MLTEKLIIEGCIKHTRKAQKALYDRYSPVMRAICIRYAGSVAEAEDILQEGLLKVFANIEQFASRGSFEGWIKRIIINTAITQIKQNSKYNQHYDINDINELTIKNVDNDNDPNDETTDTKSVITNADFSSDEIMDVIRQLPDGYRMVFNLYAIENYKHKEIAEILNIDVNTSKSQLARARKAVQKKLLDIASKRVSNNQRIRSSVFAILLSLIIILL